jgi:hypothetical protein
VKLKVLVALGVILLSGVVVVGLYLAGADERRLKVEARAQVRRWAGQLDARTTETGVYVRHPAGPLAEADPWGTPLTVAYAQGGFAETVTVASAGPDRAFHTDDDLVETRSAVNLKGVGTGVKQNIEETTRRGARGTAKGTLEGIKDGVREAFTKKKAPDKD